MKPEPQKKKAGRPATGKKATKPNISVPEHIQKEARERAIKKGIGYSEFVTEAIRRELIREEIKEEQEKEASESTSQKSPKKERWA